MIIHLQNVYCRVAHAGPGELAWLRGYLTFTPKGQRGAFGGDKTVLFARGGEHYFPAGLLPLVQKGAASPKPDEARGAIPVEVHDARMRPCEPDWSVDLDWLAPHQLEGLEKAVEKTRGIIAWATGGGKGEAIVALAKAIPCPWLMCAPRYDLCTDVARRYEKRTGMRAGLIGDGDWSLGDGQLVCATWQTMHSKLKKRDPAALALVERTRGLMGDESHGTAAETVLNVCEHLKNAYWRYGFSGTPLDRTDRRSIYCVGMLGPVLHKVTPKELADIGFSARCTVHMERVVQPRVLFGEGAYEDYIINSKVRNARVIEAALRYPAPVMLFVKRVEHGDRLKRELERAGMPATTLFGRVPAKLRAERMRAVTREGRAVLVTNEVCQTGEPDKSIVEFRTIIHAGGFESPIMVVQQAGRGARRFGADGREVKDTCDVVDFLDEIEDDPDVSVARHAKNRMRAYAKAGHEVRIEG